MLNWLKKKQSLEAAEDFTTQELAETLDLPTPSSAMDDLTIKTDIFFQFKQGLRKTRNQLGEGLARLVLGKKEIDTNVLEDVEAALLSADVGVRMTQTIIQDLAEGIKRNELSNGEAVLGVLKQKLHATLLPCGVPLTLPQQSSPFVILLVGVNGAGKTTTIGKLARLYQSQGKKVMLAAGDTFRAAAVEQLVIWGERAGVPVIKQKMGADPASVAYDTIASAKANDADVVIIDTAGRLHNKINLMNELTKIKNVMQKVVPDAPHEVLLVLDGSTGQNAFEQAKQFTKATDVSALAITKLDGTAKGGVVIGISDQFKIPVKYIGLGEGIEHLQVFDRNEFVASLFE